MVANVRSYTPSYNFRLINFDTPRWHTLEYENWMILDATLTQVGIPTTRGLWLNATVYSVGERVLDGDTAEMYRCLVQHTSAATGTFADDRLAHPSYWVYQVIGVPLFRGNWQQSSVYALSDIVVHNTYDYFLCTKAHTSGTTFPGDIGSAGNWVTIFSASQLAADVNDDANRAETAAGAADTSADAADNSADRAEAAAASAAAAQGAFNWHWDTGTAVADPGVSDVRFDNANPASVTKLIISAFSADSGAPDVSAWVASWDDSTSTPHGTIHIRRFDAPENFAIYNLTGPVSDAGTWLSMDVSPVVYAGTFPAGEDVSIAFTRAGNQGASGPGGGDMLGANNLSDVANPTAAADNIGVGPTDTPTFVQVHVGTPTLDDHATTKLYVDSTNTTQNTSINGKVTKTGDTMSGHLSLPTGPAADQAVRKDYVDTGDAANTTTLGTKVNRAGDTMTGDLTVSKSNPLLIFNKPDTSTSSAIIGRTNNSTRWILSPGAAGVDDFQVQRFNDAGTVIDTPLQIFRSNGQARLGTDTNPTTGNPLDIATKNYCDNKVLGAVDSKVSKSGDTMSGGLDVAGGLVGRNSLTITTGGASITGSINFVGNGVISGQWQTGTIRLDGDNAAAIVHYRPGLTQYGTLGVNAASYMMSATGGISLQLGINGAWKYSIGPGGNHEIAQPTALVTALTVSGTQSGSGYAIISSAKAVATGGVLGYSVNNGGYGISGYHDTGSSQYYSFFGNTTAFLSAGAWVVSDGRLKTVTRNTDTTAALSVVNALPIKEYKPASVAARKTLGSRIEQSETLFGWVAQDVEQFLPIAVRDIGVPEIDLEMRAAVMNVKIPKENTDEAKELAGEDITIKAINDRYMLTTLWAAVQELSARNDALRAEIDALKSSSSTPVP